MRFCLQKQTYKCVLWTVLDHWKNGIVFGKKYMIGKIKKFETIILFNNSDNSLYILHCIHYRKRHMIWRPPSLSELTPVVFITGLTHFGLEASICIWNIDVLSIAIDFSQIVLWKFGSFMFYKELFYVITNIVFLLLYDLYKSLQGELS